MQFQLSSRPADAGVIAALLQPFDANARITLDPGAGLLDVISTASADQIVHALGAAGFEARPLGDQVHVSGGSTCCGGCA